MRQVSTVEGKIWIGRIPRGSHSQVVLELWSRPTTRTTTRRKEKDLPYLCRWLLRVAPIRNGEVSIKLGSTRLKLVFSNTSRRQRIPDSDLRRPDSGRVPALRSHPRPYINPVLLFPLGKKRLTMLDRPVDMPSTVMPQGIRKAHPARRPLCCKLGHHARIYPQLIPDSANIGVHGCTTTRTEPLQNDSSAVCAVKASKGQPQHRPLLFPEALPTRPIPRL